MRKFFICIFLSLLISVLMGPDPSYSTTRGIRVTTSQGQNLSIYKDYHALVVGVSKYEYWPKLPNAANDAKEVAERLKKIGFEVKLVLDPTYREMKTALSEMVYKMGREKNRAIIFYYAGHGETETLADNTKMGYIIPTDCPLLAKDPMGFETHAVSMRYIESASLRIRSKHVLMLFDSCFSGSLFALVRAVPHDITEKSALPVRQYITAGREDEQVPDKSMFKRCFLIGLDGDADLTGDGYVTGTELGMYLSDKVVNYSHRRQHPQYGKINNPELDRGDFIFVPLRVQKKEVAAEKKIQEKSSAIAEELKRLREERKKSQAFMEQMKRLLESKRNFEEREKGTLAEKRALEEELKKLKAAKAGEQDKTKMEAERRANEQQARKLADEKKALEEELKRLKAEREAGKSQQKQLAYIPKSTGYTQTKPRKIAFFPCRFEYKDKRNETGYDVPEQTVISGSILRLTEQLDKSQVPTTFYSVYSSEKSEKITDKFVKAQQIDDIWKRKSSFSDDYITNDGIIYKAGKELGVDMVICYKTVVNNLVADLQEDVDIYLFDINTKKNIIQVFLIKILTL